jgi:hypothetical protein
LEGIRKADFYLPLLTGFPIIVKTVELKGGQEQLVLKNLTYKF